MSVASGGDPHYPLNIKMAGGEEVHGNSGSFRHFLSAIVEQLHGPTLNLLVPYRGPGNFTGTSSSSVHIWDPDPIADPRTWIPDSTRSVAIWILLDRHHFRKLDPDPDPHQTEKVDALGGCFGALECPNPEKSER